MSENHAPTDPNTEHAGAAAAVTARRYRFAFLVSLLACLGLATALGVSWWRSPGRRGAAPVAASSPAPGGDTVPQPPESRPAPFQLSPQRLQSIGARIGTVASRPVTDDLRFYGTVQADERRLATVQTRFAGWIRQVQASATGDFVRRGRPLFTIYSPELVTAEREDLLAIENARALRQSTVPGVAAGAESLLAAARARLEQWQVPAGEIAKIEATGRVVTNLTFNSPVSGYIMEKNALPNQYVQPETKLYTIADLSQVWIYAQVFEHDAGKIKPGDPTEVTLDAYPGQVWSGKVDYLLPQLDVATRTLPVRLVLANPAMRLRPGMYVNVRVKRPLGRQLVVPESAVFHSGTATLAFLFSGEGTIEPREVRLGAQVGSDLVVLQGLKEGDRIVTSANFLIDSEAQLQAAAGAFMPPPPGAGQAAAMSSPPADGATVELTTEPSPPRKGSNTVRVKLADASGKPIAGAAVTVSFFMPAMPAMGMAAMKSAVAARDQGGGIYEGQAELASGGTWQVTITARRGGQTLAGKQLSVNATGGM